MSQRIRHLSRIAAALSLLTFVGTTQPGEPIPILRSNDTFVDPPSSRSRGASSPDYMWPTTASHTITSTFGEFRETHFHLGLDIGTNDKIGYEVFAARDGYISRISISPTGYGKLLYVHHPDGYTTLYAHLNGFIPRLASRAMAEQMKLERYRIDIRPAAGEFPVRRGEVIAYTGETGIGTPHLHFEVRDEQFAGINPQRYESLLVNDTIPPLIRVLACIPLAEDSRIGGVWSRRVYTPRRTKEGIFAISDTILADGKIGFAVDARDHSNGSAFDQGAYRSRLFVDGLETLSFSTDRMPGTGGNQIMVAYDFVLLDNDEGRFLNLFVSSPHRLPFYSASSPGTGILDLAKLPEGPHALKILVEDFKGNSSTLTAVVRRSYASAGFSERLPTGAHGGDFAASWIHEGEVIRLVATLPEVPVQAPVARVTEGKATRTLTMTASGARTYVTVFRPLEAVSGTRTVEISATVHAKSLKSTISFDLYPLVPEQSLTYTLDGGNFVIHSDRNAVFKSVFLNVEKVTEKGISVYVIRPRHIVLDNAVEVSVRRTPQHDHQALFMREKNEWSLLTSSGAAKPGWFKSELHRTLGDFAVLIDDAPPTVANISIDAKKGSKASIEFGFGDDLAGVEYDRAKTYIDGNFVIPEIDGEHHKVRIQTLDPLTAGPHRLMIRLADKLGNLGVVERRFVAR